MFAEPKPKGFGFSDTAFRMFILMASRRLKSDRFFTDDYRPEVYTKAGIDWVESNSMRTRAPAPLPRARAVARRGREPVRSLEARLGHRRRAAPGDGRHRMKELAPGVYSLGHGKGGHVHAFLLDAGGELLLVDTLFEGDARLVFEALQTLGRSPGDLTRIAITHAHRSHLGGLAALKRASGATVYAHRWEADIVAGTAARRRCRSFRTSR